jgi:hypothetical protein
MNSDNFTIFGLTLRRLRGDAKRVPIDLSDWRAKLEAHRSAFKRAQVALGPATPPDIAPDGPEIDRVGEAAVILADKYETDPLYPDAGPLVARYAQEVAGLTRFLLIGEIEEQKGIAYTLGRFLIPAKTVEYPKTNMDLEPSQKLIIGRVQDSSILMALRVLQRTTDESFLRPAFAEASPVHAALEACIRTLNTVYDSDPILYSDPSRRLDAAIQAAYMAYIASFDMSDASITIQNFTEHSPEQIFAKFIKEAWPSIEDILASKYIDQRVRTASGRTDASDPYNPSGKELPQLLSGSAIDEITRNSTQLLIDQADADAAEAKEQFLPCDILEFISTTPPSIKVWRAVEELEINYTKGYEDGLMLRVWIDDSVNPSESTFVDILVRESQDVVLFNSQDTGDLLLESQVLSMRIEHFLVYITENPLFSFFDPDSSEERWTTTPIEADFSNPGYLDIAVKCGQSCSHRRWTVTEGSVESFIESRNFFLNYEGSNRR